MPTRRDTLKGLGATALLTGCIPDEAPPDGKEDASDTWALVRSRIDTVVVIMMENRSFDHYFGSLTLNEGRTDVDGIAADMSNPHPDGRDIKVFRSQINCLHDPPHSWSESHDQFNFGANDGFVEAFYWRHPSVAEEAMGYLDRAQLSAFYELADAYTLCDQWFSSLMTSTQPNRFYFHCAQNGGVTNNDVPIGKDWPSIYTVLDDAGYSWRDYFANVPGLVLVPDRLITDPEIQFIDRFFADSADGRLPNLAFIEPAYGRNDDHPPAHPTAGQIFVSQVYDALAASPQWGRMAIFITYDEHGGFFDHVPPPTAPDDREDQGFGQLGFRVPGLVVGPWAKQNHVSHVVYDHTSVLAFIERLFQVDPMSERDAAADPMLDCFDLDAMRQNSPKEPIALTPIVADDSELFTEHCVTDGNDLRSAAPSVTGQDELEQWIRNNAAGTRVDRIDDTDKTFAWLLKLAEERGILIRR
jgi:phospholipase C